MIIHHLLRVAASAALLSISLAMAGCSNGPPVGSTGAVTLLSGDVLPAPSVGDGVAALRQGALGPRDVIDIEVFGVDELERRSVRIDAAGNAAYPLAGSFKAAGLTTLEVADLLTQRLRGAGVRDPQVAVTVASIESQLFAVSGQVVQPGMYPVLGEMSLMRAIASARGLAPFADSQEVVVFRTVGGRRLAALYDLRAIERGNYPDPAIYSNDVITVSDDKTQRLFENLKTLFPILSTPLIVALQN